ncbi:809_t:CDS:2 [Cetraspora pellucida]|uniref:809_t:CDS:1 n=1 Tax=Cetraspora pellucida TaxID=1433469 RepID=A0A9N9FGH9_9GLOM|nr:809_t:CDS:2 [Cetraspora pellucida]
MSFNNNFEHLQVITPTFEQTFKCDKNTHPLWSYFTETLDKKNIQCNLCSTKYGLKTGISTVKRHFESGFLAEMIFKLIEEFGLGKKLLSITADNASNIDCCGQHLASMLDFYYGNTSFCRLRCAAHILNLAVINGLSVINKLTKKAQEFASCIRCSQPCLKELKKIFAMKEITDILVVSMPNLKQQYMNNQDWDNIKAVMTLLEPIYEATNLLSSSTHPTIGDVHTIFFVIITHLTEAKNEENLMKSCISIKILEKLNKYWNKLQSALSESVLLDPSFKFSSFRSGSEKKQFAQATSISSEQAFSLAKHTINAVQNHLDDEKVRDSFCLKTWYDAGIVKNNFELSD